MASCNRGHELLKKVREGVPYLKADRRMDHDIAAVLQLMRTDALPLGDVELPPPPVRPSLAP